VSKGIRRIVALTGAAASAAMKTAREIEAAVADAKKSDESKLPQTIAALQKQLTGATLPLTAKRRVQVAIAELQS
jgi:alanyl-tRNA synthetase